MDDSHQFMICHYFSRAIMLALLFCALIHLTLVKSEDHLAQYRDAKHGIQMGKSIKGCDDGKTNLQIDWDDSPSDYTCLHPKNPYPIMDDIPPTMKCLTLPKNYFPQHFCMDKKITYNTSLPTFGDHRPLWPVFGEYLYVPPQRWLHNIEHGAVIMLYHPCAHKYMVNKLRGLVTRCIRKHIITPSLHLTKELPLALITWGCSLEMNSVHEGLVVRFITESALKGPEGTYPKEGQYSHKLLKIAEVPYGSDYNDTNLCPHVKIHS